MSSAAVIVALATAQAWTPGISSTEAQCGLDSLACPGSPVRLGSHAACSVRIEFKDPCADVQAEISARIAKDMDRKSKPGSYEELDSDAGSCTKGSRTTGSGASPGPFTDLFGFDFEQAASGCSVNACSESQVRSLCDFSTNFCNMFNLFCNSADGCTTALHDLSYTYTTGASCDHTSTCGGVEADPKQCTR